MEHESHQHHHPHGTGVRWLDIILGVAATVVSLVSLWLGLHSAHSMEKLVAANSYPYLELMRSNMLEAPQSGTDQHRLQVKYELANNGIGPARIEWVELTFKGKPVRNIPELLSACCSGAGSASDANNMDARGGINGSLVRAGGAVPLFSWVEPATPSPLFAALHRQMDQIAYSACYCSVFDECYLRTENDDRPKPVAQCTAPAVPFRPSFNKG